MKCPKCQYISFDEGERCRNCGYEFSLAVERRADELAVKPVPEGPLVDLELRRAVEPQPDVAGHDSTSRAQQDAPRLARELPLFQAERRDRLPLTQSAPPRPPLAVRRRTPPVPRLREPAEARDLLTGAQPIGRPAPPGSPNDTSLPAEREAPPADFASRMLAGLIDLLILGGVNLSVLHFTLQLSGLSWSDLDLLPWVPFVAFLLMVNGSYLVAFTATVGQTVGKMASGIRVAGAEPRDGLPPTLQQAIVRAVSMPISIGPLGLGLLPALLASDRRALHDRLAGTRVVQAG